MGVLSKPLSSPRSVPYDDAKSKVPEDFNVHYVDKWASYARELFEYQMGYEGADSYPQHKIADISVREAREIQHLVKAIVKATKTKVLLKWRMADYKATIGAKDGRDWDVEKMFKRIFPTTERALKNSGMYVDLDEVMACAVVHDALSPELQKEVIASMQVLNPVLKLAKNAPSRSSKRVWRVDWANFARILRAKMRPGVVTLGFTQMQGHQGIDDPVKITPALGSRFRPDGKAQSLTSSQKAAREWLIKNRLLAMLLSIVVALLHPEQYALLRESIVRMGRTPDLAEVAAIWPFAFNAVAVIPNHATPMHRDRNSGSATEYDVMTSFGGADGTILKMRGLGLSTPYTSGTVVFTSCHLHLHEVSASPKVERLAIAAYIKPSVQRRNELKAPRAPTLPIIDGFHERFIKERLERGENGK